MKRHKYTDQQLIDNYKLIAHSIGHPPTQKEYDKNPDRIVRASTIYKHFGKWENIRIKAGFLEKTVLYENVVANVQYIAKKIGHVPTKREYNADSEKIYHTDTLTKKFGSWSDLIVNAGFKRPRTSRKDRQKYINFLLLDLYNQVIQHPNIYLAKEIFKFTQHGYSVYREFIGKMNDIKRALYIKYGIKITKQATLPERIDIFIDAIRNYVETHKDIPSIKEFEAATGLCIRSSNKSFTELLIAAVGTAQFLSSTTFNDHPDWARKIIINRLREHYNNCQNKEELTYNDIIRNTPGINWAMLRKYYGSPKKALIAAKIPIRPGVFNKKKYSDEQVIRSIKSAAKYYKHTPSLREYDMYPRKIMKAHSILDRFAGKWNNIIALAGLKPNLPCGIPHYTRKQIVKNLILAYEYYGCTIKSKTYNKFPQRICSSGTIVKYFGSWAKALKAANIKTSHVVFYTDQEIITHIQQVTKKLKHIPGYKEYSRMKKGPCITCICKRFGSWSNALEAAGLKEKSAS